MTFLPTEYFDYLADGHVDLWFKKRDFTTDQKAEFLGILDDSGYTYDIVRKKDSELRIREKDVVRKDQPDVQGTVRFKKYGAQITVNLRSTTIEEYRNLNTYIAHHEMGHALGLAHRFNDPITETVMNYPTFNEIATKQATLTVTRGDLNNIRDFKNAILNDTQLIVGDDILTGTHTCGPWCYHTAN